MTDLIIASVSFVVITIVLFLWNVKKLKPKKSGKRKKKSAREVLEVNYLAVTHKLKKEKLLNKKFLLLISVIDSLIICSVFLVIMLIPYDTIWKLMAGFVLLLGLIYSIYAILGKILVMKGFDK